MDTVAVPLKKTMINPWACEVQQSSMQKVPGSAVIISCSGQMMIDESGNPVYGNIVQQLHQCFANLEQQLQQSGYALSDVTSLNFYTTSVDSFFGIYDTVSAKLKKFREVPSCTLKEVKALTFRDMAIEIEAVAAR